MRDEELDAAIDLEIEKVSKDLRVQRLCKATAWRASRSDSVKRLVYEATVSKGAREKKAAQPPSESKTLRVKRLCPATLQIDILRRGLPRRARRVRLKL